MHKGDASCVHFATRVVYLAHAALRVVALIWVIWCALSADNFKTFNDHYGHDAGDAVLCHIADQAHKHFIDDDVVARVGGEEFAVMSLNRTSEQLMLCLEEFRQKVAGMEAVHYNKTLPAVSVSLGYAMYPQHALGVTDLIKEADAAMYRSKSIGRNCVHEALDKKAA